ncbi:DUF488 domain-containing protein [Thauera linaloolentis]|uniref:DUF488 domain-containing protein n=1 Tax=Thauera linaloolentis (strain DSM 12138 / JCM 21573 / CCUG 41526 / CIP 105981 / IAM 15112 / NBRC 102519 / 47Lol) TaxID=1123367 RepID=N6XRU2_THAL4|nr:DUF488 domain-containing protein [Thauera linaloolentis]ENO84411.1 hypothetical protein C666_17420 [Thauera linaloolentis 47Lol = DSM 12138]MCM8565097.1 DUF488 domain-containing protein [Thauera linaloolentis]
MDIRIQRIYDPPSPADGCRVLVDRLWPRGIAKEAAALDHWLRDLAPSTELRRWFGHDPARWNEFRRRYAEELRTGAAAAALDGLRALAASQPVLTLLYAAHDGTHNNAAALREHLLAAPADGATPPAGPA